MINGPQPDVSRSKGVIDMRRLFTTIPVLLLRAATVFAQPSKPAAKKDLVEFEMMTWPEVKAALAAGKTPALFYTGGTEQRGPPTGAGGPTAGRAPWGGAGGPERRGPQNANGGHTLMGREIVRAIALRLGNAIAMPVLPYTPHNPTAELPRTLPPPPGSH